jgi:hypothetical protein
MNCLPWGWKSHQWSRHEIEGIVAVCLWEALGFSVGTAIKPNDVSCCAVAEVEAGESVSPHPCVVKHLIGLKMGSGIIFGLNGYISVALNPAVPIFTDAAFVQARPVSIPAWIRVVLLSMCCDIRCRASFWNSLLMTWITHDPVAVMPTWCDIASIGEWRDCFRKF